MFKINLKIALRNLWKNKTYTAINIGGLALGLTAFILLLLFINNEKSYDTWDPQLKQVYQIRERHDFFTPDNKPRWQHITDSRIGNLLKEKIPQFSAVTKIDNGWGNSYSIKIENKEPILVSDIKNADSMFFKVFPYEFLYGDEKTALSKPFTVVVKQSFAKKLFGTDQVLGKQISVLAWRGDEAKPMTITGVVKDTETPETVAFNAMTHTGRREVDPDRPQSTNYCQVYALATQKLDTTNLNKTLLSTYITFKKANFAKREIKFEDFYKNGYNPGLKAVPMTEVHINPTVNSTWLEKIKPLIAISLFLLLISIINFVNLSTAQSVQRAKEVGVKKVLGVYKQQLVRQFLNEAAIQSFVATLIAVVLVEILLPSFNRQFDINLSFWYNNHLGTLLLQLFGLFLLITLLAGFYPAWIISGFNPVKVLKGNYETSFKGIALRNALVILQFVIAVTFIIGIGVIHLQNEYIAHKDLGFDRSKLINIATNYEDNFVERIKHIPGVQYVGTTTQVMGNSFNVPHEIKYNNQEYNLNTVTVSMETLPALGVEVVKGRIFGSQYKQDTVNTAVLNEAAAKLLGNDVVGKFYKSGKDEFQNTFQIVGVIKDYNNESFDKAVLPTVYKVTELGGTSSTNNLLVKFNTSQNKAVIQAIEKEWSKLYPNFPMQYTSLEAAFKKELQSGERIMQIMLLFSVISVALSLLGLFALSAFMAQRRTKEIAIRKILGASDLQLINMLNRSFLILVITANVISWPVAYILTRQWLTGFAYRIDMPIWPFVIATVSSVLVAILTTSMQARKAAVNNPVNALKYE
ncbi:FtsX-like permease family protein [Pedobacter montanisoli]|uniref:ABC transporter permease n=1 Tax=Pedobacter montanisoli TaxID=2923277 RepID=A0ABS9ZX82_9SPHI|nr:ABC transporter permease [Pedobacter montanisoli]MCJ0742918.1 ABC transporter permease [Pedobacter montanisoli]